MDRRLINNYACHLILLILEAVYEEFQGVTSKSANRIYSSRWHIRLRTVSTPGNRKKTSSMTYSKNTYFPQIQKRFMYYVIVIYRNHPASTENFN